METKEAIEHILGRLEIELPDQLRYHNLEHTLQVMECAEHIAQQEQVKGHDLDLLLTAVAYHDAGFIVDYRDHEKLSSTLAEEGLPEFGYTDNDISIIRNLIMATKIPQQANTLLEKIICDADLDYLGGDQYPEISNSLREEMILNGFDIDNSKWLDIQISFLETHHFWTDFSTKNREQFKQNVLEILKSARDNNDLPRWD